MPSYPLHIAPNPANNYSPDSLLSYRSLEAARQAICSVDRSRTITFRGNAERNGIENVMHGSLSIATIERVDYPNLPQDFAHHGLSRPAEHHVEREIMKFTREETCRVIGRIVGRIWGRIGCLAGCEPSKWFCGLGAGIWITNKMEEKRRRKKPH